MALSTAIWGVKSLAHIIEFDEIIVPDFEMDHFQTQVLENLYLEFFLENSRILITPEMKFMTTGEVTETENEFVTTVLQEKKETIEKIKSYLLYNLSMYSALLETNSFYVALNDHLLIARFLMLPSKDSAFEVKLYTIAHKDLPANYKDKIYLGRDLILLNEIVKDHLGLKFIKDSLNEQIKKLKKRIIDSVSETDRFELEAEYLNDVESLVKEFTIETSSILDGLPIKMDKDIDHAKLRNANQGFRNIKHILMELEESLSDIERTMFEKELTHPVRYVIKFKKDITNAINYIMIKVNGRISDFLNGIHFWQSYS